MSNHLPLKVVKVEQEDNYLFWPKNVTKDVYTLVYTHSALQLNKGFQKLPADELYEAWAFNGKKSWRLWKRDTEWVCTIYDTTVDERDDAIITEQLLMNQFTKTTGKNKLIVYDRIAYDTDGQAYIAYSCPIDLA